jgi:hypothetical protein
MTSLRFVLLTFAPGLNPGSPTMKPTPPNPHPHSPDHAPLPQQGDTATAHPSIARRFLLLLACIALGLTIGFIGQGVTSESIWFLAVPICIAIGWFFVADPTECIAPQSSPRQDDSV